MAEPFTAGRDRMEEALAAYRNPTDAVRAAGGVVYRRAKGRPREVALVHRPEYDDWSLPKGKVKAPERLEAGALREVEEETGMTCLIERFIGVTQYIDRRGRDKIVWYWLMRACEGDFQPVAEVDELRWLPVRAALLTLSYVHDQGILGRAALSR